MTLTTLIQAFGLVGQAASRAGLAGRQAASGRAAVPFGPADAGAAAPRHPIDARHPWAGVVASRLRRVELLRRRAG